MKNTFYSQGNPYNIVRTTSATYTASVGELIIADETEITLPSGVPAGSVIAVRSSNDTVTTDVVGESGSIDGFSAGATHREAKTGEYVYDGSDWYLRNDVDISNGAIPDSGDLQSRYDFSQEDGSAPVTDLTGNGHDLTGTYSGVGVSINGVQAGDFDGVDDLVDTTWSSLSEPYSIFVVVELRQNRNQYILDGAADFEHAIYDWTDSEGTWQFWQDGGTILEGGTPDTSPHVITAHAGSSTDILRLDGSQLASADAGSKTSDGLTIGDRPSGYENGDMKVGEVLFYAADKRGSSESTIEQYLADKWGITI